MTEKVLIAEDEPHIVESLSFVLQRAGFSVRAVSDGAEVLPSIQSIRPDAVILDIMLPNRNGFEVLKQIKAGGAYRDIPVLMLSAKGQEQDRATARQLGADAFITKPFSNREVVECLAGLLGGKPGTDAQ